MTETIFRKPDAGDLSTARKLLAAAGLPVADIRLDRLAIVAEEGDTLVGVIGLEAFAESGLLRSLVVAPEKRGSGIGLALVAELESSARQRGLRELWLLTIDADPFFERLGYQREQRASAPREIQLTEEFAGLCPGSAVLMKKVLGD